MCPCLCTWMPGVPKGCSCFLCFLLPPLPSTDSPLYLWSLHLPLNQPQMAQSALHTYRCLPVVIISQTIPALLFTLYLHCLSYYRQSADDLRYTRGYIWDLCKSYIIFYLGAGRLRNSPFADSKGILYLLQLFMSTTVSESVAGALFVPYPLKSCHLCTGIIDAQSMVTIVCLFSNLYLEYS